MADDLVYGSAGRDTGLDRQQCLHRHLMERWHDSMRSQRDPDITASTNQLEGRLGRFKPRAHLPRRLKTEVGALNFVCLMVHAMA